MASISKHTALNGICLFVLKCCKYISSNHSAVTRLLLGGSVIKYRRGNVLTSLFLSVNTYAAVSLYDNICEILPDRINT